MTPITLKIKEALDKERDHNADLIANERLALIPKLNPLDEPHVSDNLYFCAQDGADSRTEMILKLVEALDWARDSVCNHFEVAKTWLNEHHDVSRYWCGQCHSWVYKHDLENLAQKALADLCKELGVEL